MAAKKKQDFEQQLSRLQEVVAALESGDLPLEKSVALYKEGLTLSRACREQLQTARNEIRLFAEGELQAFDPESTSAASTDGDADA